MLSRTAGLGVTHVKHAWWHYWCAGLQAMLSEEDEWFCEYCLSH